MRVEIYRETRDAKGFCGLQYKASRITHRSDTQAQQQRSNILRSRAASSSSSAASMMPPPSTPSRVSGTRLDNLAQPTALATQHIKELLISRPQEVELWLSTRSRSLL